MAMVVGPPRLLMLAAIAVASCLFVFTQYESGVREERYGGWRKRELGYGDGGGVWRPVQAWRQLLPYSAPRVVYHAPVIPGSGFLFATIRGEFHEIHAAVCDFVVIGRLLNATIVLPKIQGIGSKVERFGYLYDEERFIAALSVDVRVVKRLPKKLRVRAAGLTVTVLRLASVQFYLDEVLPGLVAHGACGLLFSDGGGLQSLLPPELVEYQRLRCRVAFHALRFRREIHELGLQLVRRLEAHGRPYVVVHLGLERDVLARHGCAELFQDLQTESIQSLRKLITEEDDLQVDSQKQRHKGLCPLMPGEVGLLLESFGFGNDTRIYMTGAETTGGQRTLLPLRSTYPNLEDRFTMSTLRERSALHEAQKQQTSNFWLFWRTKSPPARAKGWWRSVGDCESNAESYFTSPVVEKSVRLLDAALDYVVSLEANSYFPAFDRDRHGFPDMSSLVMGHRLYQSASLKTFRPNRSVAATLVDECPYEHPHKWGAWALSVRRFLVDSLVQLDDAAHVKADMFLAHPLAECVCRSNAGEVVTHGADGASSSHRARVKAMLVREGVTVCPAWMA